MGSIPADTDSKQRLQQQNMQPYAVMFPYPAQGHINPMMQLAKRLLSEGFAVTFINTGYNHRRLFNDKNSGSIIAELKALPNLRFELIEDGLPENHGRFNQNVVEVTAAILALPGTLAKLVKKLNAENKVTCIISDAFCTWVQEVADQISVPRVSLWTTPVHANLGYHFQARLMEEGYIPLKGDKQKLLSEIVTCIPGIAPMKLEDHISFFLIETQTDFLFQWHLHLCMRRPLEAAWNLGNNFSELESESIAAFRTEVPNFLAIGPLLLLESSTSSGHVPRAPSLLPEASCDEWLSQRRESSVLYISFGSLVNLSEPELADLIDGIRASHVPFIWAVRPDQSSSSPSLSHLKEILAANPSEGLIVAWAPQVAVLSHPSVGAFLSHCGWNSVTEAICSGVPILAKPGGFAEQRMNAHYVAQVWKVGLRLPAAASPDVVKTLIISLLGGSGSGVGAEAAVFRRRAADLKQSAKAAVSPPAGSSYTDFRRFVDDMRSRASS